MWIVLVIIMPLTTKITMFNQIPLLLWRSPRLLLVPSFPILHAIFLPVSLPLKAGLILIYFKNQILTKLFCLGRRWSGSSIIRSVGRRPGGHPHPRPYLVVDQQETSWTRCSIISISYTSYLFLFAINRELLVSCDQRPPVLPWQMKTTEAVHPGRISCPAGS